MTFATTCSGMGIFSSGNINPVKSNVGINMPINDMSIAACCDEVAFEIKSPSAKQVSINKQLSKYSNKTLPLNGISKRVTLKTRMTVKFKSDRRK